MNNNIFSFKNIKRKKQILSKSVKSNDSLISVKNKSKEKSVVSFSTEKKSSQLKYQNNNQNRNRGTLIISNAFSLEELNTSKKFSSISKEIDRKIKKNNSIKKFKDKISSVISVTQKQKGILNDDIIITRKERIERGGVIDLIQIKDTKKNYKYKVKKLKNIDFIVKKNLSLMEQKNIKLNKLIAVKLISIWWKNIVKKYNKIKISIIKIQNFWKSIFLRKSFKKLKSLIKIFKIIKTSYNNILINILIQLLKRNSKKYLERIKLDKIVLIQKNIKSYFKKKFNIILIIKRLFGKRKKEILYIFYDINKIKILKSNNFSNIMMKYNNFIKQQYLISENNNLSILSYKKFFYFEQLFNRFHIRKYFKFLSYISKNLQFAKNLYRILSLKSNQIMGSTLIKIIDKNNQELIKKTILKLNLKNIIFQKSNERLKIIKKTFEKWKKEIFNFKMNNIKYREILFSNANKIMNIILKVMKRYNNNKNNIIIQLKKIKLRILLRNIVSNGNLKRFYLNKINKLLKNRAILNQLLKFYIQNKNIDYYKKRYIKIYYKWKEYILKFNLYKIKKLESIKNIKKILRKNISKTFGPSFIKYLKSNKIQKFNLLFKLKRIVLIKNLLNLYNSKKYNIQNFIIIYDLKIINPNKIFQKWLLTSLSLKYFEKNIFKGFYIFQNIIKKKIFYILTLKMKSKTIISNIFLLIKLITKFIQLLDIHFKSNLKRNSFNKLFFFSKEKWKLSFLERKINMIIYYTRNKCFRKIQNLVVYKNNLYNLLLKREFLLFNNKLKVNLLVWKNSITYKRMIDKLKCNKILYHFLNTKIKDIFYSFINRLKSSYDIYNKIQRLLKKYIVNITTANKEKLKYYLSKLFYKFKSKFYIIEINNISNDYISGLSKIKKKNISQNNFKINAIKFQYLLENNLKKFLLKIHKKDIDLIKIKIKSLKISQIINKITKPFVKKNILLLKKYVKDIKNLTKLNYNFNLLNIKFKFKYFQKLINNFTETKREYLFKNIFFNFNKKRITYIKNKLENNILLNGSKKINKLREIYLIYSKNLKRLKLSIFNSIYTFLLINSLSKKASLIQLYVKNEFQKKKIFKYCLKKLILNFRRKIICSIIDMFLKLKCSVKIKRLYLKLLIKDSLFIWKKKSYVYYTQILKIQRLFKKRFEKKEKINSLEKHIKQIFQKNVLIFLKSKIKINSIFNVIKSIKRYINNKKILQIINKWKFYIILKRETLSKVKLITKEISNELNESIEISLEKFKIGIFNVSNNLLKIKNQQLNLSYEDLKKYDSLIFTKNSKSYSQLLKKINYK